MSEYAGITVSNGVIGAVSSQRLLKVSQTVISGAYDKNGRGRVDNIVETFPILNMEAYCNG